MGLGTRADEYRRNAEEADKLAKAAEDAGNSLAAETYRDVARKWRELAEKAEAWGF